MTMIDEKLILWNNDRKFLASLLNAESLTLFLSEGKFEYIQTDHYNILKNQKNQTVGFELSYKNNKKIKNFVRVDASNMKINEKIKNLSIMLGAEEYDHIDEVQDFCEFYISREGNYAIIFLNLFDHGEISENFLIDGMIK